MASIDSGAVAFHGRERILKNNKFPTLVFDQVRFTFYKTFCSAYVGDGRGVQLFQLVGADLCSVGENQFGAPKSKKKSIRLTCFGVNVHVRELAPLVYVFRADCSGEHYTVVYGYGIDNDPEIWNATKRIYHTKRVAGLIDSVFDSLGGFTK